MSLDIACVISGARLTIYCTCPRDSQSEEMVVSSVKITLPQSKTLQEVAKARRSTACPSVKPSLDAGLRQKKIASLKRFTTVREVPGKLVAALIWFAERNGFSS